MGISDLILASLRERKAESQVNDRAAARVSAADDIQLNLIDEARFKSFLALERRRAERSKKPFMLMLLDTNNMLRRNSGNFILRQTVRAVGSSIRETDLFGWYETGDIFGIIFTEITSTDEMPATEFLRAKVERVLQEKLGASDAQQISISIHLFPQQQKNDDKPSGPLADSKLYPDLAIRDTHKRGILAMKRAIDLVGSALLLILFSPFFALIAVAIKLSSKGPVFFKQERLGQFGTRFQCLKFRTMYVNNDPKIHQEYAKSFIANKDCAVKKDGEKAVYKITNDPRVTSMGRLLRKTSLDELPQFLNVFSGEMSLVGPRPPVLYEFVLYDHWHQRRVLELKPGVTGLWQVSGRSSTNFDEMVRLDLRYYRTWSLWLDIKILLRTPFAVIFGDGAY